MNDACNTFLLPIIASTTAVQLSKMLATEILRTVFAVTPYLFIVSCV